MDDPVWASWPRSIRVVLAAVWLLAVLLLILIAGRAFAGFVPRASLCGPYKGGELCLDWNGSEAYATRGDCLAAAAGMAKLGRWLVREPKDQRIGCREVRP